MSEQNDLKRTLGFFPALATVMGTLIGGGVFFKAASVFQATGTASLGMLAWFVAGVITICAGLTVSELAAAIPKTGGMVEYVRHIYGDLWAFLLGWVQVVIYIPATIAALALMFSTQVLNLLNLGNEYYIPIAVLMTVILYVLNFMGSKTSGIIQSISFVVKLIPIGLIIIFGLLNKSPIEVSLFPVTAEQGDNFFAALGNGLLATMFAYDGWIHVGNISGEMKNPKKDLPKAIVLGISLVMVVYLLINMAYLFALPIDQLKGNAQAPIDVATKLFGANGGKFVTIGILISVFGCANGYVMSGMRIPYAIAKAGHFPSVFKKVSKTGVSITSGILIMILAAIYIFVESADELTDMLTFVIWIFYVAILTGVIILRKREPDLKRPYKVPLYPFVPLFAICGGIFIVVVTLITKTQLSLIGIGSALIGIPVYFYYESRRKNKGK